MLVLSSTDEKRLLKFLQPEKSPKKRLGYALDYIRNTNKINESRFMNEQYEPLFDIIVNTLKQYDEEEEVSEQSKIFGILRNTAIKKIITPKSQEEKYLNIIELLDRIVYHLPHYSTKRSYTETLKEILTSLLHPDHCIVYRLPVIEILLRIIQQQMEASESPETFVTLLLGSITYNIKAQTPLSLYVNRSAPIPQTPYTNIQPIAILVSPERDREISLTPDQLIVKYLEVLFRTSIYGLNQYEGSTITRSLSDRAMDEVNNFIFWRDFIFTHFSTLLIGSKAVEYYLANLNSIERDGLPAPSRNAPILPNPRTYRFTIVPHSIQCAVETWILEALSSRHLVDHLFSADSMVHVFILMEQRFHSELVRTKLGIDLARRTIELYSILLSETDVIPKNKTIDSTIPSLQSFTATNSIETLSTPSLPTVFSLSKKPFFLLNYWDASLARIAVIVLQCFNRIDEGESTATLQSNQSRLIRDCLALIRLILNKCQSPHVAQRIRERLYDISKLYLPRSRSGVVGATLIEVVEVTVASHLISPDWRDPQLHSQFSLKVHEWLIDKTVIREDNIQIVNGGFYNNYSKPGDNDAPPPSEFKFFLLSLWGTLLFTAYSVCWMYLDYYRDIDLKLFPEYLTHKITPKEILEITKLNSDPTTELPPQTFSTTEYSPSLSRDPSSGGIIQPASHSQAHSSAINLWPIESQNRLHLLSITCLYDAILCIDRLLALLPLHTISILSPSLHTITICAISDVLQHALKHVIVKENHFVSPLPLPVDKVERSKQKLVNKSRAKLEEYERGSATCAVSPDTILSLLFPFILVAAVDVRPLFENSRIIAVESLCIALHTRTLSKMSQQIQEQCLGLIYQALMQTTNIKFLAIIILSCSSFFSMAIPGSSLFIEPFLTAIETVFQNIQWKGQECYRSCLSKASISYTSSKYSSEIIIELLQLDSQGKLPSILVVPCLELLSGIISYINMYPNITSASGKRRTDVRPTTDRGHTMEMMVLVGLESNQLHALSPRIVNLIHESIQVAKEYSVKNQMIHFLIFTLLLQFNSSSTSSSSSLSSTSSLESKQADKDNNTTEKSIVSHFKEYLKDDDKVFVIGVIEGLLNLNDLHIKSLDEQYGKSIIELLASTVQSNMIELLQIIVKRFHSHSAELLSSPPTASSCSPIPNSLHNINVYDDRERVKSLDETLDRSERRKIVNSPGPFQVGSSIILNQSDEEKNKLKSFVDVIKAGLNCLTRWALNHPTLIESPQIKELFFDCFDVCSIHSTIQNLVSISNNSNSSHNDDILPQSNVSNDYNGTENTINVPSSVTNNLTAFSFAMNYLVEEERIVENIRNDQLPKILHKKDGKFKLSDLLAITIYNQDSEIKEIGKMVDIHMKHLLRFYRNYPLCESGLSYVDSKLATDFVGLSRTDLRKFMGSTYASFDDIPSDYTENTFDLSLDAKDVLLPPEGSTKPIIINEDGLDCLSNEDVEKQYPIHIAYKSTHIMTLVEGIDGVARLITRDVMGAHVWTAIPIDVLPIQPSKEAVEKYHIDRLDRADFVSHLISTEASLFQDSQFVQENPLRKKSDTSIPESHTNSTELTDTLSNLEDVNHIKRPSVLLKKRSAPLLGSCDIKSSNTIQKKSHRVTTLIETLHNDNSSLNSSSSSSLIESKNNSEEDNSLSLPDSSPDFLRSCSVDTGKALHSKNLRSLTDFTSQTNDDNIWKNGSVDLSKDVLREFLEELPLEDVEDATLLGGVRTLKELEKSGNSSSILLNNLSINSSTDLSFSTHQLQQSPQQTQSTHLSQTPSRYIQMHNWINKMLSDGFLWGHFLEFLRKEFSEESGCFLKEVHDLHSMVSYAYKLSNNSNDSETLEKINSPTLVSVPLNQGSNNIPYRSITTPIWKSYSYPQLMDTINQKAESIFTLYLTKGSHSELNVSNPTWKDVTSRFQSSYYTPKLSSSALTNNDNTKSNNTNEDKPSLIERDLSFFEKVFLSAFQDVSTMLVRDKLTRFLIQANSNSTILNDIESTNCEIEKAIRYTKKSLESCKSPVLCSPPSPPETITLRDPARLLISHLGLLPSILAPVKKSIDSSVLHLANGTNSPLFRLFPTYSTLDDYTILCGSNISHNSLQLCQWSPTKTSRQILQELRHLDDISSREQFKLAVLYVAKGQYTQRDILANSSGSELYEKFLRLLGTDIDLATHRGFNGRLDSKRFSNGRIFPYYADDHVEVFFHVATRMPTVLDDEQQIGKKRHIGNDYIHIVWTEDSREYSPLTITSDFGDVVITVSPIYPPLSPSSSSSSSVDVANTSNLNQLPYCVIRIYVKDNTVKSVGPLLNGMIVPFSLVGSLVRLTAIQANRAVNTLYRKMYDPPYIHRLNTISDVVSSCGVPFSYDLLLNLLYQQNYQSNIMTQRATE